MVEQALLDTIEKLLTDAGLTPAPQLLGIVEPVAAEDLPALVLAVEDAKRIGTSLGNSASLIRDGALAWRAEIDLANPFLPGDTTFSLVADGRKVLTLPHGGLVRADGSEGPLSGADISVTVAGNPRTLVAANPSAAEFSADPLTGTLVFGAALPNAGIVVANYFLGQWERQVSRSEGVLRLTAFAADAAAVRQLSENALTVLSSRNGLAAVGLNGFTVMDIGSIAGTPPPFQARQRTIRFRYQFELEVDVPDSSGGIIRSIPIHDFLK